MQKTLPIEIRIIDDEVSIGGAYIMAPFIKFSTGAVLRENIARFSTSITNTNLLDSYSITIDKADEINERAKPNIGIEAGLQNSLSLYADENLKVFSGLMNTVREVYGGDGTNQIIISGNNFGKKISQDNDSLQDYYFSGSSMALITYVCGLYGLEYSLSYTDTLNILGVTVDYSNGLALLNNLKQAIGPNVEMYIDAYGKLIARDVVTTSSEFYYTEEEIQDLKLEKSTDGIYTSVEVVGSTDSLYAYVSNSAMVAKYGEKTYTITSDFINSYDYCGTLASAFLSDFYDRALNGTISFTVPINPQITVGSLVVMKNLALPSFQKSSIRVAGIRHNYSTESDPTTKIVGYAV